MGARMYSLRLGEDSCQRQLTAWALQKTGLSQSKQNDVKSVEAVWGEGGGGGGGGGGVIPIIS